MISTLLRAAFSACFLAIAMSSAQAQPAAGQKTVGLITALGGALTIKKVALAYMSNSENRFSVEGWKLDDHIETIVQSLLKKNYQVKRIGVANEAFASLGAAGSFPGNFDEGYKRLVKNFAGSQKADFYLAITPGFSPFGVTDQILSGVGVVQSETLLNKRDVVYCLVLYRVFDAKFNLVRSEGAVPGQTGFTDTVLGPNIVLEGKKRLPTEAPARTVANDARVKDFVLDMLDKNLTATLPKLFAKH